VDHDPEFEWSDNFRTARKSNESRQLLFYRLSCDLRRQMALKVHQLKGNAILAYKQCFDIEGDRYKRMIKSTYIITYRTPIRVCKTVLWVL
jgi:hypothetical protein